jgi:hypothetical protein
MIKKSLDYTNFYRNQKFFIVNIVIMIDIGLNLFILTGIVFAKVELEIKGEVYLYIIVN